jgi:hypothetical protein
MATDTPAVITPTITLNEEISAGVGIALSVTMILSFFIFFVSGSGLAVIVFWLVLILCVVILVTYGYLPSTLFATKKTPPPPTGTKTDDSGGYGLVGMEVFHINNSTFTYDDAQAGCAAFGGTLATLEQVNDAYNEGAEWCGYGCCRWTGSVSHPARDMGSPSAGGESCEAHSLWTRGCEWRIL